jgi:hypothetical protein
MSANAYAKAIARLRAAAVHAAWTQWSSLGLAMHGAKPGHAVIDPEALVLASVAFDAEELRLNRVLQMWLSSGARVLSAGRYGNLLEEYPESVRRTGRELGAALVFAGDVRFRRIAGEPLKTGGWKVSTMASTPLVLRERTTLLLKLRLAFGVGIKADALAFLIGLAPSRHSVRAVADRLGYEERPTRRALEDLAAAGLIAMEATSPVSYRADLNRWSDLFGFNPQEPALWRNWRELYLVVALLSDWIEHASADWSTYVAGSRLRDQFEKLEPTLLRSIPDRPDWTLVPDEWPSAFESWAARVESLMRATA